MKKIISVLGNLIIVFVIVVCLPLAVPRFLGFQEYNVISGSMEPEIPVGSLVYVKQVGFGELQTGDIIAFTSGASVVTHRVVEMDSTTQLITTKGDANDAKDFMPVAFTNVLGKVVLHIPFFGIAAAWISDLSGKLITFGVLIFGLLLSSLSLGSKKNAQKKEKSGINPKVILALGLLIVFGSLGGFAYIYMGYAKSENLYDSLEQTYVTKPDVNGAEVAWQDMIDVDIDALKNINPDVVGWLYVENTDISYPILFSGDDETYLRTTIDKEYATAGSIFLEGYNLPDFSDSHNIIYGHNMRNLSMFGKLRYYKSDEDYYDEHKYFQVITSEGKYRYEIFSYFDTEPASWVYTVPYYDNEEFQSYIDNLNTHSYRKGNAEVLSSDKVVTLSTCSAQDMRFTVHGYMMDYVEVQSLK